MSEIEIVLETKRLLMKMCTLRERQICLVQIFHPMFSLKRPAYLVYAPGNIPGSL